MTQTSVGGIDRMMSRERDLEWFEKNRLDLANKHSGQWLIILEEQIRGSYPNEEEAVVASVTQFGINEASVFQAVAKDPVQFVAFEGERVGTAPCPNRPAGNVPRQRIVR